MGIEPIQLAHTCGYNLDGPACRCVLHTTPRCVIDMLMVATQERVSPPQLRRVMVSFWPSMPPLAHETGLAADEDQVAEDFVRSFFLDGQ